MPTVENYERFAENLVLLRKKYAMPPEDPGGHVQHQSTHPAPDGAGPGDPPDHGRAGGPPVRHLQCDRRVIAERGDIFVGEGH